MAATETSCAATTSERTRPIVRGIPNGGDGIGVDSRATNTVIGGTTTDARNVISGNGWCGVELVGGVTGAVIEGNYIGTNAAGTAALGNFTDGVRVGAASDVTVGGTAPGAGNVISGNGTGHDCCGVTGAGVGLIGVSAIAVEGNLIGTDASGTYAIPNTSGGVQFFQDVSNTVIGGTTAAARNVISGNGGDGVGVGDGLGSGNMILGNYIGTNAAGTAAVPNNGDGIGRRRGSNNIDRRHRTRRRQRDLGQMRLHGRGHQWRQQHRDKHQSRPATAGRESSHELQHRYGDRGTTSGAGN